MSKAKKQNSGIGYNLKRFFREDTGATAIEYGIIAGGISIVIVTVVFALGTSLETNYFTPVEEAFD
ncbi:MAG: Flp family type IVb pilin [Fimbriimonadaceae bacterium]|nr:Flp family type IVb pilin [Alphaproteobacteria bacterium]